MSLPLVWPRPASAQMGQDMHAVIVFVLPVAGITVSQPSVQLLIDGSGLLSGQTTMTAVDESTLIAWRVNQRHRKLTIHTDLAAPRYTLKARAVNATAGTPMPEAAVLTTPRDFIRDIGRSVGYASIRYTGTASMEQGSGTENHLITLTITSQ
jgi:hypothetical protein